MLHVPFSRFTIYRKSKWLKWNAVCSVCVLCVVNACCCPHNNFLKSTNNHICQQEPSVWTPKLSTKRRTRIQSKTNKRRTICLQNINNNMSWMLPWRGARAHSLGRKMQRQLTIWIGKTKGAMSIVHIAYCIGVTDTWKIVLLMASDLKCSACARIQTSHNKHADSPSISLSLFRVQLFACGSASALCTVKRCECNVLKTFNRFVLRAPTVRYSCHHLTRVSVTRCVVYYAMLILHACSLSHTHSLASSSTSVCWLERCKCSLFCQCISGSVAES